MHFRTVSSTGTTVKPPLNLMECKCVTQKLQAFKPCIIGLTSAWLTYQETNLHPNPKITANV